MKLGELKYGLGVLGGFDLRGRVDTRHGPKVGGGEGGEVLGSGRDMSQGEGRPTIYIPLRSCSRVPRGSEIRYGRFLLVARLDSDPFSPFSATDFLIIASVNHAPPF